MHPAGAARKIRITTKRDAPVHEPSDPPRNDEEEDSDLNDFVADIGLPMLCGLSLLVLMLLGAAAAVLF
jgi:hypothetical protein